MVVNFEGVEICVCGGTAALEVFSADETGVDVDVGKGDGTEFFEIEIED